ncbi:MAG: serine hydrolase [Verrucomicrobiota bacterium]
MKTTGILSSLCLSFLLANSVSPVFSHNGAIAFAYPLENIVIDGDLSDWPSDMKTHEVSHADYGAQPENPEDLSCHFRIGYNPEDKTLLIAAEVNDDSPVGNPTDYRKGWWQTQDGFEVYLDRAHRKRDYAIEQYSRFGTHLENHGAGDKRQVALEVSSDERSRRYEWSIKLGEAYEIGRTFGFDISVTDKDKDGSFSWLGWGSGIGKVSNPERTGDLILLEPGTPTGQIAGKIHLDTPPESKNGGRPFPPITIQSMVSPGIRTRLECNEQGEYQIDLPSGPYTIGPIDTLNLRVDESGHHHVHVEPDKLTKAPPVKVATLAPPDLVGRVGVLHENEFNETKVDAFINAHLRYFRIPGLSIAIVKDGKIVYQRGMGVKTLATDEAVEANTLFEVASLTKPMFAYAVCRLVERGVLDLDTPLYHYLTNPDVEEDERYKKITARFVLCHRTGFPNWRDDKLVIGFTPGTQQQYSGEGFEYLARVVAHLEKKSISDLMQEEVFDPLGIKNTALIWTEASDANATATPHSRDNFPMEKSRWSEPWMAGCLHTDAGNFARFMVGLIEKRGLSPEGYAEMFRPQFEMREESRDQNFGLGFVVGSSASGPYYWHGGHNRGFTSAFEVYPDQQFGYVFAVNNYQGPEFNDALRAFLVTGKSSMED